MHVAIEAQRTEGATHHAHTADGSTSTQGGPGDTPGAPQPPAHRGPHRGLAGVQALLAWWRERHQLVQDAAAPERQLERQTYHVEKRFIEAVRREADLTGESYAAIVNRAFAQYFASKSP
ncbi:MAG TPA: hypothetical protein VLQ80_11790 [Candidatus Saccharimonadia bacterium]|nr:hypothetical protein [Candidatus Saccharimonadia bacterium]